LAELDDLLDEVLRGIGRNVLNLQKMEGMLKFIVSSTGKVGSTTDLAQPIQDLERSIKKRRDIIRTQTMGALVNKLSETLQASKADQGGTAGSDVGFSIEISFTFENEDYTNQLSQTLKGIVEERNDLIHNRLISFDRKSVESCRELIGELKEQHARIEPQYEALSAICLSLTDCIKQTDDYMNSDAFADDLKRVDPEPE
jgi:hypothetical protein